MAGQLLLLRIRQDRRALTSQQYSKAGRHQRTISRAAEYRPAPHARDATTHNPGWVEGEPVKTLNAIDKHVGGRIRMRRVMLAMSQQKLGDALGVTFQQVQKYEKGGNRLGASQLQQISHVLQVPVEFFFEGAPSASATRGSDRSALSTTWVNDFVTSPDGLRLTKAFQGISDAGLRRRIVLLVKEIAGDDGD
jgi:transcriptional regulator with XRE-family HTH domain